MFSSEETYLEAFIEQLSTLPHQLRRNLDLLKDLDGSSSADLHKLRQLQRDYILATEEKIMQLEVVEMDNGYDDGDEDEDTASKMDDDDEPSTYYKRQEVKGQQRAPKPVSYGIRVLNEDGTTTSPDNSAKIVPTTEELVEYVYRTNARLAAVYPLILKLQQDCLQKADEKVAVAQQAYEMMDAQVQRLDSDLAAMEQLLQVRVCLRCFAFSYFDIHTHIYIYI